MPPTRNYFFIFAEKTDDIPEKIRDFYQMAERHAMNNIYSIFLFKEQYDEFLRQVWLKLNQRRHPNLEKFMEEYETEYFFSIRNDDDEEIIVTVKNFCVF